MLKSILLIIFFIVSLMASAQNNNTIKVKFENASFNQMIDTIEANTPYYFYYDSSNTKDIKINVISDNISLNDLLSSAFRGSDLFFSVDEEAKHVFVSKQVKLQTVLFKKEFEDGKQNENNSIVDVLLGKNVKSATPLENKLYEIGTKTNKPGNKNVIITGYIRNTKGGEPIVGVHIFESRFNQSTTTDQYGFYTLSLPVGSHNLSVQGMGMSDAVYHVSLLSEGKFDIDLSEKIGFLKEVVVISQKQISIQRVQMGVERLTIQSIKKVPTVFGEADILKAVLTLPGVKTVGEASTGFNVRGGSADQNLILFNDATIFNPSHFFGLFSAFNPEIIKDIQLYKSSIPAKYGGRLSSVLDITGKEGKKKILAGQPVLDQSPAASM